MDIESMYDTGREEKFSAVRKLYTHDIKGPKRESCGCEFSSQKPDRAGVHVARSHDEVKSSSRGEPSLEEGLPLRHGMGDMKQAIDDGGNREY